MLLAVTARRQDATLHTPTPLGIQEDWEVERAKRRRMPAIWQLIRENILTHRKRKVQDEDDVMVCQCKHPSKGGDGCGENCINRMLCIECTEVSLAVSRLPTAGV